MCKHSINGVQYQIKQIQSDQIIIEKEELLLNLFRKEEALFHVCLNLLHRLKEQLEEDEKIIVSHYIDEDFEQSERIQITLRKKNFDKPFFSRVFNLTQEFSKEITESNGRILIIADGLW